MKKLWDISPLVHPDAPLFPGDEPYRLQWTARLSPQCPVNLSALTMSPHVGAHADAPLHYANEAPDIAAVDLDAYLGPCRVIHAIGCGPLIRIEHVEHAAEGLPSRVLVRTCERADTVWKDEFTAYAPETVAWLAARGVRLIGLDTPSVDPASSKSLDSHQQLLRADLRVLENLVLDEVPAGDYELLALPLKLAGACASPVRAVLREL
ncbi:arylformamidase [Pelomonas sp. APW6]|uniref:Kynurenine formamidase n=1 Tax=Roseateles subflavus TaxID=3053353 RepID=A0ABT7LJA8_9BURK|nr:arylformamidase [Pelomonas sp. APW6]MDL5032382.1 arylformamidase [Pelomonas sp. APW6]